MPFKMLSRHLEAGRHWRAGVSDADGEGTGAADFQERAQPCPVSVQQKFLDPSILTLDYPSILTLDYPSILTSSGRTMLTSHALALLLMDLRPSTLHTHTRCFPD